MELSQKHVEDLLVAVLSVNNYAVTKTWELLPGLRQSGLTDPMAVADMDAAAVLRRLQSAGYVRGGITDIVAPRVQTLMARVASGELDMLPGLVDAGRRDDARQVLLRLDGVGPRVAATAWMLLSSTPTNK
jgi:hypothetical protein